MKRAERREAQAGARATRIKYTNMCQEMFELCSFGMDLMDIISEHNECFRKEGNSIILIEGNLWLYTALYELAH